MWANSAPRQSFDLRVPTAFSQRLRVDVEPCTECPGSLVGQIVPVPAVKIKPALDASAECAGQQGTKRPVDVFAEPPKGPHVKRADAVVKPLGENHAGRRKRLNEREQFARRMHRPAEGGKFPVESCLIDDAAVAANDDSFTECEVGLWAGTKGFLN